MACHVVPLASTGLILPGKTPVTALASAPSAPGPTARATSSITSVLVERVSWNRLSASSAGCGPRTTRRPLGGAAGAALAGAFGSGANAQGSGRVIAHSSVRGRLQGFAIRQAVELLERDGPAVAEIRRRSARELPRRVDQDEVVGPVRGGELLRHGLQQRRAHMRRHVRRDRGQGGGQLGGAQGGLAGAALLSERCGDLGGQGAGLAGGPAGAGLGQRRITIGRHPQRPRPEGGQRGDGQESEKARDPHGKPGRLKGRRGGVKSSAGGVLPWRRPR
jgi:hypothetical protein